jgi:hypothetical protein
MLTGRPLSGGWWEVGAVGSHPAAPALTMDRTRSEYKLS